MPLLRLRVCILTSTLLLTGIRASNAATEDWYFQARLGMPVFVSGTAPEFSTKDTAFSFFYELLGLYVPVVADSGLLGATLSAQLIIKDPPSPLSSQFYSVSYQHFLNGISEGGPFFRVDTGPCRVSLGRENKEWGTGFLAGAGYSHANDGDSVFLVQLDYRGASTPTSYYQSIAVGLGYLW